MNVETFNTNYFLMNFKKYKEYTSKRIKIRTNATVMNKLHKKKKN